MTTTVMWVGAVKWPEIWPVPNARTTYGAHQWHHFEADGEALRGRLCQLVQAFPERAAKLLPDALVVGFLLADFGCAVL